MRKLTVEIDDDLYEYLEFLERMGMIYHKGEAVLRALTFFKRLSMHDWTLGQYRMGDARIILMERGMLLDLLEPLTEFETYRAGSLTALKRRIMRPEFREVDLTKPSNWMIILKELENFGWGTFTRIENEIKVENCAVPFEFLRGYLESMLKWELEEHRTEMEGLIVFIAKRPIIEDWR